MTNEDAIRVFESWIEQDKNLKYADRLENIEIYQIAIEALKAQRPHGEWVRKDGKIYCSVCGAESGHDSYGDCEETDFCPNCGSDNRKR